MCALLCDYMVRILIQELLWNGIKVLFPLGRQWIIQNNIEILDKSLVWQLGMMIS